MSMRSIEFHRTSATNRPSSRQHRSSRLHVAARSALVLAAAAPLTAQGTVERVSVDSAGIQTNQGSAKPMASSDGRYVVFFSNASNLVPGDTNGQRDVFVRDRLMGTTERVNLSSAGAEANAAADNGAAPDISADGRFVVFASTATNLVPGDANGRMDVFLRDRLNGTTTQISVTPAGGGGDDDSYMPAISADGLIVAFTSKARNLLGPNLDTNGWEDVFVWNRATGVLERVSVDSNGQQCIVQGTSYSGNYKAGLSVDGRYVVFGSSLQGLTPEPSSGGPNRSDVYRRDRLLGITTLVSITQSGASDNTGAAWPSVSGDGDVVAFQSASSSLVPGDTGGTDVFVRDMRSGTLWRVSESAVGGQPNGISYSATIDASGRYVAFTSQASNLTSGDSIGSIDVFLRDLVLGVTREVSVSTLGFQLGNNAGDPHLSGNGRYFAFVHNSAEVVGGDTNSQVDVFLTDLQAATPTAYCFGDGLCPCGNNVPAGTRAGCRHSMGNGASLLVGGDPRLSLDTIVLSANNLTGTTALFFQGTTRVNGGSGAVFGDGLRCAGGTVVRLGTQAVTSTGGRASFPELGDLPIHVRGSILLPGTRTYQVWYRNSAVYCTADLFNLTNGIEVVWGA